MAKIHHVKKAQQRYATVPVIDPATGQPKTKTFSRRGKMVTQKVTTTDKAQPLPPHDCVFCRKPIQPGTPYKWVAIKTSTYSSQTMYRHEDCPTWRQSELTTSKMAGVYAAQEGFEDEVGNCESIEDLESLAENVAQQIRDVAMEYEESADNIEDGFGHETYQSAELREKQEALESWADDIENVSFDDRPDCPTCEGGGYVEDEADNGTGQAECPDCEGTGEANEISEEFSTWLEDQREALREQVNACPI